MRFALACALVAIARAGVPAAADAPPAGFLVDIGGPGGCIAQTGDPVGQPQHLPAADGCADGRGFQQLHHVVLSADERFVYTVSGVPGGNPGDESAIGIFSRDAVTGALKQLPGEAGCIERMNPPRELGCALARNLDGLRFVTVSGDNRFLYATGETGIAVFRRDASTGGLTQLSGYAGCISPTTQGCRRAIGAGNVEDLAITAKGELAYAASSWGFLLIFTRNPVTGTLKPVECYESNANPALLASCTPARAMQQTRSVTISPDDRFVYAAGLRNTVAIFSRNPLTGHLTQLPGEAACISEGDNLGCVQARGIYAPHRLTITRDGRFAHLAGKHGGDQGSALAVFRRDPVTGRLTQLPGKTGCFTEDASDGCAVGRVIRGAHAAILDGDERTLYLVSDRDEGGIAIFRRNTATGVLTELPGSYGCLSPIDWEGCARSRRMGGLHYIVISRDGRFVYAAGENAEALVVLRVVSPVPSPRRGRARAVPRAR